MPMEDSLLRRVVGQIVSKAAIRPRRIRIVSKPESGAMRRSLVTVQFLCYEGDEKPDWNCSFRLCWHRWE